MKRLGSAQTEDEHAAEALIAAVPGWADLRPGYAPLCADVVSPVHRGVESRLWRIAEGGRPVAVLKQLREDMADLFDASAAIDGAEAAAACGVGPQVLWSNRQQRALAMTDLSASHRTATLADLHENAVMAAVLERTQALHRGQPLTHRFDVFAEIGALADRTRSIGAALPDDAWWLMAAARDVEAAIAAAGFDLAPCRNDGVSSNVMIGSDGTVLLVDYDRAGLNDPVYDLAVLLTESCAFVSERLPWIEYWAGRPEAAVLGRTMLYGAVDDLMWALWASLCATASPRIHVEFQKYAEWRFLRCRATFGDPRFEEWLRSV